MVMRLYSTCMLIFVILLHSSLSEAWTPFAFDRANEKYEAEKYNEAKPLYEGILEQKTDRPKVHYNLGDTLYRLGQFDQAEEHYLQALNAADPQMREYSLYNLGNTKYRQKKLEESIAYYDKVLEINPKNEKAAQNREFVKKQLEEQKKEQQNQEQEKQQQEQEKKEQQDQQQQQQQANSQEQPTDEKKSAEEGAPQDQQPGKPAEPKKEESHADQSQPAPAEEKKAEAGGEVKQESEGQTGGKAEEARTLSEKEAQMWLNSIDDNPKNAAQDMLQREVSRQKVEVERDW